jgi:peptide/nickel transport system permease protein
MMFNYLLRRLLYAGPIILGVMVLTFLLFFVVQTPTAMAKRILGPKTSQQVIQNWLQNRGYDKPMFFNTKPGKKLWDSQFVNHMKSLATFDLGVSDANGEPISRMFKKGAIPSLLITVPALIAGLCIYLSCSLFLVLVRDSVIDKLAIIVSVMLMSVSFLVYVLYGQWLVAVVFAYVPVVGFSLTGISTAKYLILPITISLIAGLGSNVRLYRTIFIEEIYQDYVRTAQAKGASNTRILFTHVFKNGMISLITLVVASLPFLIMGSLVVENAFGIPGLGNLMINAINTTDFAIVRSAVYLGALLYLFGLLLTDICYALVDPRIRFS